MPTRTQWLTYILRGSSVAMLILLMIELGRIYDSEIFNVWKVAQILGDLRDLFSYIFYILFFFIFYGFMFIFGFLFQAIFPRLFNPSYYNYFSNSAYYNVIGKWFYLPDLDVPTWNQAWDAFLIQGEEFGSDIYLVLLQLIVIVMFFLAVRASITANPGDSIRVITLLNIIIMVPLFFLQIEKILNIFIPTSDLPEVLIEILNTSHGLLKPGILADVDDRIWVFLTSDVFIVALVSFLYLEVVFQVAYIDKVTAPSLERESRLSYQIDILKVEAEKAVANLKAIKEKKREQKLLNRNLESMQAEMEEKKRLSLRTFMSEKEESTSFSFVSELIEKKRREKEDKKIMDAMRDTRRVSNYLDKIFRQDPEARASLTAKTSAPSSTRLVVSTVINIVTRVMGITLLTWICIHPKFVISNLLGLPAAISNSVELVTYEATLSLLIPLIMVIPIISTIIKITKHSKLKEMLRLEELKRMGLTEEEMEELKEKRKVGEEEVQIQRDQEAVADAQRKVAQQTPNQNP